MYRGAGGLDDQREARDAFDDGTCPVRGFEGSTAVPALARSAGASLRWVLDAARRTAASVRAVALASASDPAGDGCSGSAAAGGSA